MDELGMEKKTNKPFLFSWDGRNRKRIPLIIGIIGKETSDQLFFILLPEFHQFSCSTNNLARPSPMLALIVLMKRLHAVGGLSTNKIYEK